MTWLTVHYHPGFSYDLTSWCTAVELNGELLQTVKDYPSRRTIELRSKLSGVQVAQLKRLVDSMDFDLLSDRTRLPPYWDDAGEIGVRVQANGICRAFSAQILLWEWQSRRAELDWSSYPGIEAALTLWHAVDGLSPRRLGPQDS